jgi:cellulose synthase (UDP-forming)
MHAVFYPSPYASQLFSPGIVGVFFLLLIGIDSTLLCLRGWKNFRVLVTLLLTFYLGIESLYLPLYANPNTALDYYVLFYSYLYLFGMVCRWTGLWLEKKLKDTKFDNALPYISVILGGLSIWWSSVMFWEGHVLLVTIGTLAFCAYCLPHQIKDRKHQDSFKTYDDLAGEGVETKSRLSLRLIYYTTQFFAFLYLGWRLFFTLPVQYGWFDALCGILLFAVEALGIAEYILTFQILSAAKTYPLPLVLEEQFPDIDVFIATYNEDAALVEKTIQAAKDMEYPDPDKVHIYVCDDGDRPAMKALANKLGVHYLRRDGNKGAKAGNLNNALAHSNSPLIVTFDADMIPRSNFLMETVPYFVDAENRGKDISLGFVQTPQAFYNPDLFQSNLYLDYVIPNEQDFFYRNIETAKTQSNSVIYGGSNTVLSRQALNDAGGFFEDAITEDFATGLNIQKQGYVSLALDTPLASGLSAEDFPSLVQQRVRWGRGVINTLHSLKIFSSSQLSAQQKLSYWTSIWYWFNPLKRFIYFLMPILASVFAVPVVVCQLPQILIFWIPVQVFTLWTFSALSGNARSTAWSNLYETILFPFLVIPVFAETLGFSLKTFKVTKKGEGDTGMPFLFWIPFLILSVFTILGILFSLRNVFVLHVYGSLVTLFWLVYNMAMLVLALLFLKGKGKKDIYPLRKLNVQTLLDVDDVWHAGISTGADEKELETVSDQDLNLSPDKTYAMVLRNVFDPEGNENDPVFLQVRLLDKQTSDHLYSYRFGIESCQNPPSFWRLLYDRPVDMDLSQSSLGLARLIVWNIGRRLGIQKKDVRAPEIVLDKEVKAELPSGTPYKMVFVQSASWNRLKVNGRGYPHSLVFYLDGWMGMPLKIRCTKTRTIGDWTFFKVDNPEDILRAYNI